MFRHWFFLIIGFVLLFIDKIWQTSISAKVSVLQLEDSDFLYGVGKAAAGTTGLFDLVFWIGIALVLYCAYKLVAFNFKPEEEEKVESNK